ncbi:MAG TPA: hypothetical protein VFN68_04410 [Acidimicrobiales bacterium]|nr:hypothetical protein [Acidimicrobiales bacterium]
MADDRLEIAEALLAKARSTAFAAERESFVAGAYGQLGAFLGSGRAPRRPVPEAGPERPVPQPPAGALPPGADDADAEWEPPLYVDLTVVEKAYAASRDLRRPGLVVDLTI